MLLYALALTASAAPPEASAPDVDQKLASFFASARAGSLLHPLTHTVCDDPERKRQNRLIIEEYDALERRYTELGGRFLPADQQDIMLEAHHYSCPRGEKGRRLAGKTWASTAKSIEQELKRVRKLLSMKRDAAAASRY